VDPAAERAESVHSENTDPGYLVRRLLKDVEGQPDGGEDKTIICEEEYADHHRDGEFKDVDVERESLHDFGDAEEMAEHESSSSSMNSGSLEDRQKMKVMLSNIQKKNQAYQASRQPEVVVELSPLGTSPSLTSPSSSNGAVPLSNGQRIAPDGHIEDRGVSVGSEGFRNPVCPPSLLEGFVGHGSGRPVPPTTSTLTNPIPAHSGHMTMTSHTNGPHLQPNQQQHGSGTSTPPVQRSIDGNRTTAMNRTVSSATTSSDRGYLQSSELPGIQVIPQQPSVGGDSSFNLMDLSLNNENSTQNLNLQSSLGAQNLSGSGYVQQADSMTSGGDKSTLNLNTQPPRTTSTHILSSGGYVQGPTSMSVGGKREERGPSTESGNEEDFLSNEGDSNSVFDDDLIPSENPAHLMRPRSTVTSGFQSGSSESASSPEPPKKSTSSLSSLLSSGASTVVPPSIIHAPSARKNDSSTNFSLPQTSSDKLSSNNSFAQHTPHSHAHPSSSISPTSVIESTFTSTDPATYHPSSTGGSSGYVTNESSQSYTYHGSSATSQTSQAESGLAPSELEQELNLEDGQKYTVIPSLLACGSKSSSPAISRAAGSNWTPNDTSAMQTDFAANTRHCSHGHHLQATSATVMDYVNTSDVELSKISTDLLGAIPQASDRVSTGDQGVSFMFPTSST
jgi:hypothetical protein